MDSSDLSADLTSSLKHKRTIIHLDVDCFYAQVEMVKDPVLRNKPLGIKQKNIVVTSNYIARDYGIQKCMLIADALKLCPELVLVSGEDLYDYRKTSAEITNVLQTFSPHVEKLGLDENFIDVTQLVSERLMKCETASDKGIQLVGHQYNNDNEELCDCECGCHPRLCIGSQIASEMRKKILEDLQITTCAGISYNKLLAKLVCTTHKPNQQTTLFPSEAPMLVYNLEIVRGIPGVGHCMQRFLESKNVTTISDLQNAPLERLQQGIGLETALRIKKLSFGIDDSPVKQTGKPQTIGLEDGFQKIGLECEVKEKFAVLLQRLMKLLLEDGRIPGSVKITVRKYDSAAKHSHRESRQCNISPSLFSPNSNGELTLLASQKLISSIMQLFHKIVDISKPFHLTLLGVAFTKFQERNTGRNSITSFLQKDLSVQSVTDLKNNSPELRDTDSSHSSISAIRSSSSRFSTDKSGSESEIEPSPKKMRKSLWVNTRKRLADEMDQEDSPSKLRVSEMRLSSPGQTRGNCSKHEDAACAGASGVDQSQSMDKRQRSGLPCAGVDETVFRELPVEMQEELIAEWSRTPIAGKANVQEVKPNTILNYFIPNTKS